MRAEPAVGRGVPLRWVRPHILGRGCSHRVTKKAADDVAGTTGVPRRPAPLTNGGREVRAFVELAGYRSIA